MGTTAYIFYASCSCINLYSNMGVVVIPACVHFGCYALSFLWRCRQRYLEIKGLIGCMITNFLAPCIEFCFPYVMNFFFSSLFCKNLVLPAIVFPFILVIFWWKKSSALKNTFEDVLLLKELNSGRIWMSWDISLKWD